MTNRKKEKKKYLLTILFLFIIAIIFIFFIFYPQNKNINFNTFKREGAATATTSKSPFTRLSTGSNLTSSSTSGLQSFNTHNSITPSTNLSKVTRHCKSSNQRNLCSTNSAITANKETQGSVDNPIVICSAEQFNDIRKGLDKHYVLGSDIDLEYYANVFGWNPIGTEENKFSGSLNGRGYKIKNIPSNQTKISALFGYATNAEFKDLILEKININSQSNKGAAALVFDLYEGNISNVSVNGDIYSVGPAAGIAHTIQNSKITNCFFVGSIESESPIVGGLIGFSDSSIINNSYTNISEIKGVGVIGGLVGKAKNSSIFNSYSIGGVINSKATEEGVGGLIGNGEKIKVYNCFSTNKISIQKEWSTNKNVGGLIGIINNQSNVSNCFSISDIITDNLYNESIGGLIGSNIESIISNCYSIGNINILNDYSSVGVNQVGGFVGNNLGIITNSYSLVKPNLVVTDSVYNVGGLVGTSEYIVNSYWDINRSGITEGIRQSNLQYYGDGKETQLLNNEETFQNWDFINTWKIDSSNFGYPYLRSTTSLLFLPDCYELGSVSFNYESGVYNDEINLILGYNNNNPYCSQSIIKYTIDGTDPTISSLTYNSPIKLSKDTIIKAKVFSQDLCFTIVEGPTTTKEYYFDLSVANPYFEPWPGAYDYPISVSLNTLTEGAQIRYSINGSAAQLYTKPIDITSTTRLSAIAYKPGYIDSELIKVNYIIDNKPIIETPYAIPESGEYSFPQFVYLKTDPMDSAVIKYRIKKEKDQYLNNKLGSYNSDPYFNYDTTLNSSIYESYISDIFDSYNSDPYINNNYDSSYPNPNYDYFLDCDDNDLSIYKNPLFITESQTIQVIGCDPENPNSRENQSEMKTLRYVIEKKSSSSSTYNYLNLGTGEKKDPIIILTPKQLNNIRLGLNKHYVIGKDINLSPKQLEKEKWYDSNKGWLPIGTKDKPFTGTIDGANHKISGLYINRENTDYVGLFGYVKNAEIKNIILNDVKILGKNYTGSLIGSYVYSSSNPYFFVNDNLISNNSSDGFVYGLKRTGGLIGYLENTNIADSNFSGSVVSNMEYVGGLIGDHYSDKNPIKIQNCHTNIVQIKGGGYSNNGFIGGLVGSGKNIYNSSSKGGEIISKSKNYIGGLAGATESIHDSYSDNNIIGGLEKIGGLVGFSYNITNSYSSGNIDINLDDSFILDKYKNMSIGLIGGLAGESLKIYNSYSKSKINIQQNTVANYSVKGKEKELGVIRNIGGLSGSCFEIENCYSNGLVDINYINNIENIGGLCGTLNSGVSNSYSKNSINVIVSNNQNYAKNIGGLIGILNGLCDVKYCYSINNITINGNKENIGGLIGLRTNLEINTVKNSYWDKETSKINTSAGGFGKTKSELNTKNTFVGWNFDEIWDISPQINSNHPYLRTNVPK